MQTITINEIISLVIIIGLTLYVFYHQIRIWKQQDKNTEFIPRSETKKSSIICMIICLIFLFQT